MEYPKGPTKKLPGKGLSMSLPGSGQIKNAKGSGRGESPVASADKIVKAIK